MATLPILVTFPLPLYKGCVGQRTTPADEELTRVAYSVSSLLPKLTCVYLILWLCTWIILVSVHQRNRSAWARVNAETAAKAPGLVIHQFAILQVTSFELTSLNTRATACARLRVTNCNVFRRYNCFRDAKSHQRTHRVATAWAAAANNIGFLIPLESVGDMNESGFMWSFQCRQRLFKSNFSAKSFLCQILCISVQTDADIQRSSTILPFLSATAFSQGN